MTPRTSRRALLAWTAALPSTAFLAGCGSRADGDDGARTVASRVEGTPTATATTTSSTPTAEPTPEPTPTDTTRPTPTAEPPGESRFADRACPPVLDGCYHRATGDTPVFVRPSRERVDLGGTLAVSLVNRSDRELFFGPHYWTVWREDEAGWTNVDDRRGVLDLGAAVPPGGAYTWTVQVTTDGDDDAEAAPDRAVTRVDFRPGLYCFGVREVPLPGSETAADARQTLGALFTVV